MDSSSSYRDLSSSITLSSYVSLNLERRAPSYYMKPPCIGTQRLSATDWRLNLFLKLPGILLKLIDGLFLGEEFIYYYNLLMEQPFVLSRNKPNFYNRTSRPKEDTNSALSKSMNNRSTTNESYFSSNQAEFTLKLRIHQRKKQSFSLFKDN